MNIDLFCCENVKGDEFCIQFILELTARAFERKSRLLAEVLKLRDELEHCVAIAYLDGRAEQNCCNTLEDDCAVRIDCADCFTNDIFTLYVYSYEQLIRNRGWCSEVEVVSRP